MLFIFSLSQTEDCAISPGDKPPPILHFDFFMPGYGNAPRDGGRQTPGTRCPITIDTILLRFSPEKKSYFFPAFFFFP